MAYGHPSLQFHVELSLAPGSGGALWDSGLWDTDTWGSDDPNWVDVTPYAIRSHVKSGVQFFDDLFLAGTASFLLDNSEGWFNPDFGKPIPGSTLRLRPGRWVSLRASWLDGGGLPQSVRLGIWYIDSLDEVYLAAGADSMMSLTCYDLTGLLAYHSDPALPAPVGVGERTDERISRILTEAGLTGIGSDIGQGAHTMQGTTMDTPLSQLAQDAARAEGGAFFQESEAFKFRPFTWFQGGPTGTEYPRTTTVQQRPGSGLPGQPTLLDADALWSAQFIRNDVQAQMIGGSLYRTVSAASQSQYGRRFWKFLQYQNDQQTQVEAIADRLLAGFQWDYQRLQAITVWSDQTAAIDTILRAEFGDLVEATIPLSLRAWGYTVLTHILGKELVVTRDDWAMTYRLDSSVRQPPDGVREYNDDYDDGYL